MGSSPGSPPISRSATSWSQKIGGNAASIEGNLEHVNRTGGVVAAALPLLYGMAEKIVVGATYDAETVPERGPAVPASGRRRSRLHDAIGYMPDGPGAGPTPPWPTRPSLS